MDLPTQKQKFFPLGKIKCWTETPAALQTSHYAMRPALSVGFSRSRLQAGLGVKQGRGGSGADPPLCRADILEQTF